METFIEDYINQIEIQYSYNLAKQMEKIRSNPVLGYRSAGSKAEFETGNLLFNEMKQIGFTNVHKDAIQVDGWEFKKAKLMVRNKDNVIEIMELGAYQTQFVTDGIKQYPIVYVGKGTAADYNGLDVKGKLVLVDINQRDEWWISYPVYQAHLKGAVALIAVQTGGYGEADETSLNAQDIAGPSDAPAFSICRRDAEIIKNLLEDGKELIVGFDADSQVKPNQTTYNIVGEIEGRHKDRMILLSAHYDSYFDGFQDDNTAVSMMLNIGRTLLQIGYQPENTIVFCAMASEEWGVINSPFDWSTGAYEQVFHAHPEWSGKVIADLNFELPAFAHGTRARIRTTHEYVEFIKMFLNELPELTSAYPEETRVTSPIETWSDDFSMSIAGIPSMVNDFTGGSFMVTNYHSQFDNDSSYDEDVYRMHHELFGLLVMKFDRTAVAPLDFTLLFERILERVEEEWCDQAQASGTCLKESLMEAKRLAKECYEKVKTINQNYQNAVLSDHLREAEKLYQDSREMEHTLLRVYKMAQDHFVRMGWYGNVRFPQETYQLNLKHLTEAMHDLEESNLSAALRKLYEVNNNFYAFMFEEKVYQHFTEYALLQSKDRLKWGYGRINGYISLYQEVSSLLEKKASGNENFADEIRFLNEAVKKQKHEYRDCIQSLIEQTEKMKHQLRSLSNRMNSK